MDKKRITANGIHHLVNGAEHDKDPKIRDVLEPQGFSVLELTSMSPDNYTFKLSHLTGTKRYAHLLKGNLILEEADLEEVGVVAVMQCFLQAERMYIARAVFSTSVDGNPQLSGNRYKDKE